MDGKQVAILAPTTVLAFQHLETLRARLASFPVKVDMVSRFRSKAEQAAILEQLAAGQVDILVGTHRLLSKDVNSAISVCWSSTRSSGSASPTRSGSSRCAARSTC